MRYGSVAIAVLGLCVTAPDLRAAKCGNVDAAGACIDLKTLVWCTPAGTLDEMICPDGEVCAQHDVFDGGYGCIGTEYTDCGDITETGECTSDNSLVWCDGDQVEVRVCDSGTVCAWVEIESWYDCVASNMAQSSPPDEVRDPPLDPTPMDPRQGDGTASGDDDESPIPMVTQGGAGPAEAEAGGGGSGCQGGPSRSPSPLWFAIAAWLVLGARRKRRHA